MKRLFDPKVREVKFRGRQVWEVDCRAWPAETERMGHPARRRFASEAEAERWKRTLIVHEDSGRGPEPGQMRVSDLCALYLRSVKKSDKSPVTYTNYRGRLGTFVRFLDEHGTADVRGVTPQVMELYRLQLHDRMMVSSVNQALMVVSGLFSWARRMRLVDHNPVSDIELPRQRSERRAFTDQERLKLLQGASDEWRPVWKFLLLTGLRRKEMTRLAVESFELETPVPFVRVHGKGDKWRNIPLEGELLLVAKELMRRAVAAGRASIVGYSYHYFGRIWEAERTRVGLPSDLTLHSFRHDCATRLANDGRTPLTEVRDLLGHSSVRVTETYVHRDERKLRAGLANLGDELRELERAAGDRNGTKLVSER